MEKATWRPAGDRAALVRLAGGGGAETARALAGLADRLRRTATPGLLEAVPGRETVTVYYDPLTLPWARLEEVLAAAVAGAEGDRGGGAGAVVEIPVLYGGEAGPDLEETAALVGLSPAEYARRHAACEYTVLFLGFAPGFAYLGPLPEPLRVPRLPRPRLAVPPGSVAVAADHTAVYPGGTPGGWRLIGRTPLAVYDPAREPRALLRAGDRVRFRPVERAEYERILAEQRPAERDEAGEGGRPVLLVRRGGFQTTVQDLGRWGYQAEGVPASGAVDPLSLVLANRLVGNEPGAAALEVTVMGLELEALDDVAVALAGADLGARRDGRPVPPGVSFVLRAGERLSFAGGPRGCRAYLAVAGGVAVPPVLGSRSTDLLGRLGGVAGRPLRTGDLLAAGEASAPPGELAGRRLRPGALPDYPPEATVRALLGPQEDWFSREAIARFFSHAYRVTTLSDRTGLRLEGPEVAPCPGRELPSEGTAPGSVQVPGGGQPIVLLAGCQTHGGYPKIATVITADLPQLGQARPGYTRLRFQAATLAEAHLALAEQARFLADPGLVV